MTSSMTQLRIALLQHLDQGLEAAVMEVLFHALGIDHAVVPQGHPALAIEEGHVAVKLEELPADRLALDRQAIDDLAAEKMVANDFVQIGLAGDAVEDLVGPDEHVERFRSSPKLQCLKQLPTVTGTSIFGNSGGREPLADGRLEGSLALPAAAFAAAGEDFVLGDPLDRPIEHVLQHRLAAQDVGCEDVVDQVPIDAFVLDWHLAGDEHADNRFAAQRPVQPVRCRRMSARPDAATCLRNSSNTSSAPAACSHVADPIWMRIGDLADDP